MATLKLNGRKLSETRLEVASKWLRLSKLVHSAAVRSHQLSDRVVYRARWLPQSRIHGAAC